MVFDYFWGVVMQDIRFDGHLDLAIKEPSFANLTREAQHQFAYKNGKKLYSFIFVQHGELLYDFHTLKKEIVLRKNDVLFIPKNAFSRTRSLLRAYNARESPKIPPHFLTKQKNSPSAVYRKRVFSSKLQSCF